MLVTQLKQYDYNINQIDVDYQKNQILPLFGLFTVNLAISHHSMNYQLFGLKITKQFFFLLITINQIIKMQQVLHLVFLNHRKSLNYPQNQIELSSRPVYKQVYQVDRRKFMMDHQGLRYGPNELNPNYRKKTVEKSKEVLSRSGRKSLDMYQQNLIKKYNQDYPIPEKQYKQSPKKNYIYTPKQSRVTENSNNERQKIQIQKQLRLKVVQRVKRKLKKCVNSIIFINRLKDIYRKRQKKFSQIIKLSTNIVDIMLKMINKYYANNRIMKDPLLLYGKILKRVIDKAQYKPTEDIVNNLSDISQCLKVSSIRKDILKFLTLITTDNNPLPHDYFCQFQLQRLQFDDNKFKIINVNDNQVKMIVAIFLGIKLLCNQIFYQPWNVQILQFSNKISKKIKPVVWAYSSYFYTVIINLFKDLPILTRNIDQLKKKGVKPMNLIQENEDFYDRLVIDYRKQNQRIVSNIKTWINRISNQVIKNKRTIQTQKQPIQLMDQIYQ